MGRVELGSGQLARAWLLSRVELGSGWLYRKGL